MFNQRFQVGGRIMGELIAVLSGKGGTGKTSVCAAVASALAVQGMKILCIDCDVGLRNLDIALGISELGALSFQEIASGQYPLEMAVQHPIYPGLRFLTAPMNCPAEEIDKDSIYIFPSTKEFLYDTDLIGNGFDKELVSNGIVSNFI